MLLLLTIDHTPTITGCGGTMVLSTSPILTITGCGGTMVLSPPPILHITECGGTMVLSPSPILPIVVHQLSVAQYAVSCIFCCFVVMHLCDVPRSWRGAIERCLIIIIIIIGLPVIPGYCLSGCFTLTHPLYGSQCGFRLTHPHTIWFTMWFWTDPPTIWCHNVVLDWPTHYMVSQCGSCFRLTHSL